MRNILIGVCTAVSCCPALAQSNVSLYGSQDVGIGYFNNVGGSSKWTTVNTMSPDRFGLVGQEDLGGGLKTVFRLENGFYTTTGAMALPGTIFNRQAYVGLTKDRLGTITLGRQTPFNFDWLGPLSTAYNAADWYMFHPGNIDELAATSNVQYSNSLKFTTSNYGGLTAGAMLGLGNTANFGFGRNLSVGINFERGPLRASAVYSDEHNRSVLVSTTGLSTFQGQPASSYMADRIENMGAGATYNVVDTLTLHALYTRTKLTSGQRSDVYQTIDGGATYRLTPAYSIAAGAFTTTLAGMRWTEYTVGSVYALSKATQLYADALLEKASGGAKAAIFTVGPSSNGTQLGVIAGLHHSF
ncbi:porin [Caballeronia novacaledonica]|uniref:Porin n=1 Tax=Caballeronia novacaledonica TaxID=1544861 RepID=A0AA37IKM8_9BURK|nr:porin [Caballeronia novacaledonica]GJH30994.1 porin [Caballeronia novacaledonica]